MTVEDNGARLLTPADPNRIDVHSHAEMRHWARELSRSMAEVNEAVKAVGPLVSDVRTYLRDQTLRGRSR